MRLSPLQWNIFVFTMTFLAQVSRHATLEAWYLCIPKLHDSQSSLTTLWLAVCNSAFLVCYASGNIISGSIEDRYPLRYLISWGLFISAALYGILLFLGSIDVYVPIIFVIHWALQGFAQSTVWPGVVAVAGNWFNKTNRGKAMGFWSTSHSFGDVVGAWIGALIFYLGSDWMGAIFPFAVFQVVIGLIFIFTIKDKPQEVFSVRGSKLLSTGGGNAEEEEVRVHHKKHGIPFLEAIKLPGVIPYTLNYACVKFLYYGLSIWLPYFLEERLSRPELTGVLSSLLGVGGVIGGVVCGGLGDWLGFQTPIIVAFLLCALPLLFLLEVGSEPIFWLYFIVIPLSGFFIAGASNIISSAIAVDLAQNPDVNNRDEAMATVAGIVDGGGGYGSAIGVLVMAYLSTIDWLYVFLFMMLTAICSTVCILHIAIRDLKEIRRKKRERIKGGESVNIEPDS